jgi:hypothetical protein
MLPWFRLMTVEDVEKAVVLAKTRTVEEIVAMAVVRHRKDRQIKVAIVISCLVPFAVMIAMTLRPADEVTAKIWIWVAAICIGMLLPLPMIRYGKLGFKEGRIISLAWHLKKNPRLVLRKRG